MVEPFGHEKWALTGCNRPFSVDKLERRPRRVRRWVLQAIDLAILLQAIDQWRVRDAQLLRDRAPAHAASAEDESMRKLRVEQLLVRRPTPCKILGRCDYFKVAAGCTW